MAKNQNDRIPADILQADLNAFIALQSMPGYQPNNPEANILIGDSLKQALINQQAIEVLAQSTAATARDTAVAAEWAFHNYMLLVKTQVKGQFGADSNELQSLGLKKKSEYKTPGTKRTNKP